MTKLNEKRREMAYDYAGLSPEDTPTSFNMTCFAEKAAFNCGWNSALAEVMPMMREMAETIRYVMNENDKVKGWDKLHDTWYAYQKMVEND